MSVASGKRLVFKKSAQSGSGFEMVIILIVILKNADYQQKVQKTEKTNDYEK